MFQFSSTVLKQRFSRGVQNIGQFVVISLLGAGIAWACFTPDRAAQLAQQHPDDDLVAAAAHAHRPNPLPYVFAGSGNCADGFADIFPCHNVDLLAHIPLADIGNGSGSDSWGWTDPLNGKEYAIVGRSNGVAFLDVSDPANIIYLGNLPRPASASNSTWSDIKVYQNHAFMVADNAGSHGMQVLNLAVLRGITNPPVTFTPLRTYTQFGAAHNIAINTDTGFAYAVGGDTCSAGLHMVDIRTPNNPVFAGCFSSDGYTHDVQCVVYQGPDVEHQGKEICFASNEDTLTIVDVSDKSAPVQLSRTGYDNIGYTHQGWLTEDQTYFLLDDETDERNHASIATTRTITMNVSDLDQPSVAGEHFAAGVSVDHNQYIVGDFTYQANYRRGLRILHIDDAQSGQLSEVAYIDTYPEGDGNNFNGAWNVYPFFPSGNVLISDFNRGFFLVRPRLPDTVFETGFEAP